ncbi:diguanylate cyclase [Sphingomonas sp. VNH70]|uniref:GGDEF domain-containing protein n=1 Tax=Sphingomonas silueang TaxID=3156617 RepID=UPI0032B350AA
MFHLVDPATLRLSSFLSSLAFATVFAALARGRRDPWMTWWAGSSAGYCVVLICFDLTGGVVSSPWSAVIEGMMALSIAMALCGVRRFDGLPAFAWWMWLLIVAATVIPAAAWLLPASIAPVAAEQLSALMLVSCMIAFGLPMATSRAIDGTRLGRVVAGGALIAYVPSYALAALGDVLFGKPMDLLGLIPLVADQFLLAICNLALLSIPGLRARMLLREAALRDPLTGAWNRAGLAVGEAALLVPGRVVLLVDVDHFKAVNDAHGHDVGDRVLRAIADGLHRAVAGDFVCRLGGDEFLVVTDAEDAAAAAERVRTQAGGPVAGLPGWGLSVGLSRIEPGDTALAGAIQRADRAMYRAKAGGRGRIAA